MRRYLQNRTSYFSKIVGLEYFDGPMAGVGVLPDNVAYYFKIVGWDRDHLERVFALGEISTQRAEALWAAFEGVEPPRFPEWYPQGTGSGDAEAKVVAAITAVRGESERIESWIAVQSQDLIGPTTTVVLEARESDAIRRVLFDGKLAELKSDPILEEFLRTLPT